MKMCQPRSGNSLMIDRQHGLRDTLEDEPDSDPRGQQPHGGTVIEVVEGEHAQRDRQRAGEEQ
jgi:hypothetical protein